VGKFDSIQWEMELPIPRDGELRADVNPFQTKDIRYWVEHGWRDEEWTLTVSPEGWLLNPNGETVDWSGTLNFYGDGNYFGWSEFEAKVKSGKIANISIVEIPSDLEVVRLPTDEDYAHRERLSKLSKGAVLTTLAPIRTDSLLPSIRSRNYPTGSKFTVVLATSAGLVVDDAQRQRCWIGDQRTRDKLKVRPWYSRSFSLDALFRNWFGR